MSVGVVLALLFAGLVGLWAGAQGVVRGALGISHHLGWSHTFVGLVVLAIGTDLPELFVSIDASLMHLRGIESSGIVTGNAIGSCMSQISAILGISAFFVTLQGSKRELLRNGGALLLFTGLLAWLGWDGLIARWEGAILLLAYGVYFVLLARSSGDRESTDPSAHSADSVRRSIVWLLMGFVLLGIGSHVTVANAMILADRWGIEQSFMGIAFLGLGTSLPELAVSIQAARKQATRLSIGNILGSNVFDTLVPVGTAGVISTVTMERKLITVDLVWLVGITAAAVLFMATRRGLSRVEGSALILAYLLYLYFKIPS